MLTTSQHLQSVPGFSHFHIFARRKTPPEIDISEKVYAAREKRKMEKAERSKNHHHNGVPPEVNGVTENGVNGVQDEDL